MRILFLKKNLLARCCLAAVAIVTAICIFATANEDAATPAGARGKLLPIYEAANDTGQVGISFDASWGAENTRQILDILDQYGVKATFFLVNIWVADYPQLTKEIALRGHEIGLHSATHPQCSTLSEEEFRKELQSNHEMIFAASGYTPALFRPPFGDYDDQVINITNECGYQCIQWSIDSLDWQDLSPEEIYCRVTDNISSGDIVLFHNNGLHTPEALPRILQYLAEHELQATAISDMLLTGDTYIDDFGVQRQK